MISVKNLKKSFFNLKQKTGFFKGLSSLIFRNYEVKHALNDISFEIKEGEIVGYIGPNGAGKSTTIKILSGILVPSDGEVNVLGKTPWKSRIDTVSNLGVVFGQKTQLIWDLPVIESFKLLKTIYDIPKEEYTKNLDFFVHKLELSKLLELPTRVLSLGQRMRCDLTASLLHSPKILFLDEPTIGLDAVSKLAVREFIRNLNKEKKVTIFLTTHDMDDIESLCPRVIILNEGKIFLDGSLRSLREKIHPERYLIVDLQNGEEKIEDADAIHIRQEGKRAWISFNPVTTSSPYLIQKITSKYAVNDLFIENPSIEEIIAKFYRHVNL